MTAEEKELTANRSRFHESLWRCAPCKTHPISTVNGITKTTTTIVLELIFAQRITFLE
jgi:hypothetical protein